MGKLLSKALYRLYRRSTILVSGLIFCSIRVNPALFSGFKPKCGFLFNPSCREDYRSFLENLACTSNKPIAGTCPNNVIGWIIHEGDKILNHTFDLLGSGDRHLGVSIRWNEDFKAGIMWKNKFYLLQKLIEPSNNADVKVPWELSRFQHFFTLGKVYWLTGNEKYALEFMEEIEDWNKKNPPGKSINWTCSMEVAIRAVNWITAYFFFCDSASIPDNFWNSFHRTLYMHGLFIYNNPENTGLFNGNHYIADLAGLIWLGIYFSGLKSKSPRKIGKRCCKWLEHGVTELEKEMLAQTNNDGTDYEASTAYHALVTEITLLTAMLCSMNNIKNSPAYITRLEKMCRFTADIAKPGGSSPIIGDIDNGRLLIPSGYFNRIYDNFCYIPAIAGEYFDNNDLRCSGMEFAEEVFWFGSRKTQRNIAECNTKNTSSAYRDGGYYAYRDGGYYILRNSRIYCFIRCGELSCRGAGGHSHNDQLSFELNIDGCDIIVDPGCFTYTADFKIRNHYRSTQVHNTLFFEGFEQNDFNSEDLFEMREQTFAECVSFTGDSFTGRHFGFAGVPGYIHNRSISITDMEVVITDTLYSSHKVDPGIHTDIVTGFTLGSGIESIIDGNRILLKGRTVCICMSVSEKAEIRSCMIAPGYGKQIESKRIIVNHGNVIADKYTTVFHIAKAGADI